MDPIFAFQRAQGEGSPLFAVLLAFLYEMHLSNWAIEVRDDHHRPDTTAALAALCRDMTRLPADQQFEAWRDWTLPNENRQTIRFVAGWRDPAYRDAIMTIPNVICAARLVSSPGLIVLALIDRPIGFVILFTILTVSDWIDGRLARMLHQVAVIALIAEWSVWLLRLAALAVTWTNLETTCMSLLLPTWRADVSSLSEVLKERKQAVDRA